MKKKLVSTILTVLMISVCMPVSSFALDNTTVFDKAKTLKTLSESDSEIRNVEKSDSEIDLSDDAGEALKDEIEGESKDDNNNIAEPIETEASMEMRTAAMKMVVTKMLTKSQIRTMLRAMTAQTL